MAISIEEARQFVEDAKKGGRENWLKMANASWAEIKKVQSNGKLYSTDSKQLKKKARYPAWNSIFKIRQPLLLSRPGIPVGKDSTQDGNDNVGATAAILIERLATNLAKTFDFFDVMQACRDDALATNFTTARGYYECKEVTEHVKEYLTPQQQPDGQVVLVDQEGQIVVADTVSQDDEGYYIEHEETVDIEREAVYLDHVLYKEIYIDPDIKRWKKCERVAFELHYSRRQFERIFGRQAVLTLPRDENGSGGVDAAEPKKQNIKVFEYWDKYENATYYFAENGTDFITPQAYIVPKDDNYDADLETNGLYNLEQFFPNVTPMILNAPTDCLWPIPEYYQLVDILEDLHTIFTRMFALTKGIRTRLMFDNGVDGLEVAISEASEGDSFGVPNLTGLLMQAGGKLDNAVQYLNVAPMVEALNNMYIALENRLSILYKLTGTSDLLQGFITDQTDRTFGERQMQEKYALNQVAEAQRKMAEFVRDCYQLLTEIALKNFKDESLAIYMMPQTLPEEHKPRYEAALGMLKQDPKRFRIELETDSTIALNEEYDKAMKIEMVNVITTALEKAANVSEQNPALMQIELHAVKVLLQAFRQGKLFQGELVQAVDQLIERSKAAADAPPPFNKDESDAQLKLRQLDDNAVLKQMEIISNEKIEVAKLQNSQQIELFKAEGNQAIASLNANIETYKAQINQGKEVEKLRLGYAELNANIAQSRDKLLLEVQQLVAQSRKDSADAETDAFRAQIEADLAGYEVQFRAAEQKLEEFKGILDLRERYITEARLQQEANIEKSQHRLDALAQAVESQARLIEASKPEAAAGHTVTINSSDQQKASQPIRIKRDSEGRMLEIHTGNRVSRVLRDERGDIASLVSEMINEQEPVVSA